MRTAAIAAFKARLGAYLAELAEGPLVLTRHGRPTAVILGAPRDPEELDSLLIACDPRFQEIVARSKRSRLISHSEFWRRAKKRYGRAAPSRSRKPKRR